LFNWKKKRRPRIRYRTRDGQALFLSRAELIRTVFTEADEFEDKNYRDLYIKTILDEYEIRVPMSAKQLERAVGFGLGVLILAVAVSIAIFIPNPTSFQANTFRILIALGGAAFGAFIPGFLNVNISSNNPIFKFSIRAFSAMAVFVILYFWNPAQPDVQKPSAVPEKISE
jgi:hypothetical protein